MLKTWTPFSKVLPVYSPRSLLFSTYRFKSTSANGSKIPSINKELRLIEEKRIPPPKRPLSSYMLFCQVKRKQLLNLSVTETAKELGKLWRATPEEERLPYIQAQQQNMLQYRQDYSNYINSLTTKDYELEKKRRHLLKQKGKANVPKIQDPNRIKKPLTAYFRYAEHIRATDEQARALPITEFSRHVSRKWEAADENIKNRFKKEYEQEMAEYKTKLADKQLLR